LKDDGCRSGHPRPHIELQCEGKGPLVRPLPACPAAVGQGGPLSYTWYPLAGVICPTSPRHKQRLLSPSVARRAGVREPIRRGVLALCHLPRDLSCCIVLRLHSRRLRGEAERLPGRLGRKSAVKSCQLNRRSENEVWIPGSPHHFYGPVLKTVRLVLSASFAPAGGGEEGAGLLTRTPSGRPAPHPGAFPPRRGRERLCQRAGWALSGLLPSLGGGNRAPATGSRLRGGSRRNTDELHASRTGARG
jgi:hypothetical protein